MRTSGRLRLRVLLAGLVFSGTLLIGPLASPTLVSAVGPLPPCKLQDILTVPRGYDDWATTLVDWNLGVGPDYKPPDLVNVREGNVGGGGLIRAVAIDGLKALAAAAKANGTPLVAWSPYRPYTQQAGMYKAGVRAYGLAAASTYWAQPGHSEHQLGTTIDFAAVGDGGLSSEWESTKAGGWMAKNAWKYGWIMTYPNGKQDIVCLHYEPWHYRYFGVDLAKKIHDSGLTSREYLWANFTQVDGVTWQELASPTPAATASPSPAPTPAPSPTAVAIAAESTTAPGPIETIAPLTDDSGTGSTTMLVGAGVLLLALFGGLAGWVVLARRPRNR